MFLSGTLCPDGDGRNFISPFLHWKEIWVGLCICLLNYCSLNIVEWIWKGGIYCQAFALALQHKFWLVSTSIFIQTQDIHTALYKTRETPDCIWNKISGSLPSLKNSSQKRGSEGTILVKNKKSPNKLVRSGNLAGWNLNATEGKWEPTQRVATWG